MGRASIVSGGEEGYYTIQIDLGSARINARIAKLDQQITVVDARIAQGELDRIDKQAAFDFEQASLNQAIASYSEMLQNPVFPASAREEARKLVIVAQKKAEAAAIPLNEIKNKLGLWKIERASLVAERGQLQSLQTIRQQAAWCADLTESGFPSQEVATLEVPGEVGVVLVAPGARSPASGDGQLMAREAMTGPQAYFNAAILPGWQKFKPTYRFGTISNIDTDNDTADVELEPAVSSAQGLDVNWTETLTGVPVEYMTCNAEAFEDGDSVVVAFTGQNQSQPKVIGFKTNPKACSPWVARWTDGSRYAWTTNQIALFDSIMDAPLLALMLRSDSGVWSGMYEYGSIPGVRRSFVGTIQSLPGGGTAAYPPFADFKYNDSSTGTALERVFRFNPSGASGLVGSDHVRLYAAAGSTEVMFMAATIDALWSSDVRGEVTSRISLVGNSNPILKLSPFDIGPKP